MKKSIITQDAVNDTVTIRNGIEVVRSDKLAKMFGKQHKNVLKIISNQRVELLAQFGADNINTKKYFISDEYSTQGGTHTRYYLTRKGFDLIALSLTGKNALKYKIWYIDSFHDKQRVIEEHKLTAKLNKTDDLWIQFRDEGKVFRNKLTDAIRDHVTKYRETVELKMNDGKYYYHYTSLIYSILNIALPKGTNPRDVLGKRELVRLEDLEDRVADMIIEYSKDNYYKDVYQMVKKDLLSNHH
jgi:Rha family phage regulatory protein